MQRLWESAYNTAQNPQDLEVIWHIDDDDRESLDCANLLRGLYPDQIQWLTCPRHSIVLSQRTNECYGISHKDIVFTAGDDIIFRSENWDVAVLEAFEGYPDKIACIGGDDLLNYSILTHFFLHRNWIETLGEVVPGFMRDCYCDTWVCEVAESIGRLVRLDIVIEHLHYSVGKMVLDKTGQERLTKIQQGDESGRLFLANKAARIEQARRLQAYIDNYEVAHAAH